MKVYGAEICVDCRNYKAIQEKRGFEAEYIDITESTKKLKEFLEIRDTDPMFEEVKNESKYKTLEEYLKHEDFISFCNNCKISDLIDQDENERIIAKVKYIFDQIA